MRFLVDAQVSPLLCEILRQKSHDAKHVKEISEGTLTPDSVIIALADQENRIIITKDLDFYNAYAVNNKPLKLLLITTGNTKNKQLFNLFRSNLTLIESLFETYNVVELSNNGVIAHEI